MNKNTTLLSVCIGFLLTACSTSVPPDGKRVAVAEADGIYLYQDEVEAATPTRLSGKDSIDFVKAYIRSWGEDALFYKAAESNIADDEFVQKAVEDYRQNLIINLYQDRLVRERLGKEISDSLIRSYYDREKELFVADYPLMKGLFIKVAKGNAALPKLRKQMKLAHKDDRDRIERFSLSGAVDYKYFCDTWTAVAEIAVSMPTDADNKILNSKPGSILEMGDERYVCLLRVDSILREGDILPMAVAQEEIKEAIYNERKAEFISTVRKDLLRRAEKKGRFKIFAPSEE